MDALELLDELEDIIDKGASVPFSGRCILDKDELLDVLQEIKLKLPDDLKQAKWIKEEGIDFENLEGSKFDNMLGLGSGAGVIFGNSGGVTEAAVRTAYHSITGEDPTTELLNFEPVRGLDGVKKLL